MPTSVAPATPPENDAPLLTHAPKSRAYELSPDGSNYLELNTTMPPGSVQPAMRLDAGNRLWEEKAADAALRMRVNGESAAQMAWAHREKASGRDFSVDQDWQADETLAWIDTYLLVVMVLVLLPKALLLGLPLLLCSLPITAACSAYAACMPSTADRPVSADIA